MTAELSVRQATEEDVAAIAPLFDQYRQFYQQSPNLSGCTEYLQQRLRGKESVVFFALTADNIAAGFTQLYPSFCSVEMASRFVLYDLFVAAEQRRSGIGALLLDRAQTYARECGADHLSLETAVDNHQAQKLYEALGWKRDTDFYTYHFEL